MYTFLTLINKLLLARNSEKNVVCRRDTQISFFDHFKKMSKFANLPRVWLKILKYFLESGEIIIQISNKIARSQENNY